MIPSYPGEDGEAAAEPLLWEAMMRAAGVGSTVAALGDTTVAFPLCFFGVL